ncbi:iron dicitrate transport regulator FecR [Chitinophaga parva]|uniref:Iron dicitrate transport regulator FecR n=1 Tax=Chitinophaga parva TaxID=2169414 RepID=A0A2T7BHN0_9BACT|nr:FecR family protein [Chitinophaga parva]PUZ25782.1 iron dicitrate transport regulator FecR [Chitinophaga parva]
MQPAEKDKELLSQLLERYAAGTASPEEQAFAESYLTILDYRQSAAADQNEAQQDAAGERIYNRLQESIRGEAAAPVASPPVHRVHFLRRYWWAAAAGLLLLAVGGYELLQYPSAPGLAKQTAQSIPPGRNGAVLTLANGAQVTLDSLQNGFVATQPGAQVSLQNGQLQYNHIQDANATVVYNTMTTPRGRQYQVILPDGTRVWLNAASSLTYPTVFTGGERKVRITGEAYFEVAGNAAQPFIVSINDEAGVEVLGTSFNVNAYKDGGSIDATLVEGLIRVSKGSDKKIVKPGQQAQISGEISLLKNADMEKALAWRNGIFNFEDVGLREMMMQIERWYDIQVVYAPNVPEVKFFGKVPRKADLETVLGALKGFGLHYEMLPGRKLMVMP